MTGQFLETNINDNSPWRSMRISFEAAITLNAANCDKSYLWVQVIKPTGSDDDWVFNDYQVIKLPPRVCGTSGKNYNCIF